MKTCALFFAFLFGCLAVHAQQPEPAKAYIDTLRDPTYFLPTVKIIDEFKSEEDREAYYEALKNYERLRHNVRKVYPLAKACSGIINEVNSDLESTKDPKKRKKYMKKLEKELFKKYEKQLKSLSMEQGRVLVKLINRECGSSAFELIEEYKSGGAAIFWQLVAKMFGNNLKAEYDRNKERAMEAIIKEIEQGDGKGFKITTMQ